MSQEHSKILQMLDEGKMTVDEATVLLKTVQSSTTPAQATDGFRLGDWIKRLASIAVRQKVEETVEWQLDSAALQAIAVQAINGSVHYTGADTQTIAIHAHKVVRAPDVDSAAAFAPQVQLRSEIQDGILHIYAEYPKPPRYVPVEVTFTVRGPRALNVTGQSTNGNVSLQKVEGIVRAQSTNGKVHLAAITGRVQAKTTNGNLQATALTLHGASEFTSQNGSLTVAVEHGQPSLKANTVNGSVLLTLPADYAGQVDAKTQNGQVRTDFPIRTTQLARTHVVGQIGAGGPAQLTLRSQNGNVTLAANAHQQLSEPVASAIA